MASRLLFHRRSCCAWSARVPHLRLHNVNAFSNPIMRLNAFFPTRDIGTDPAKIRDWAQAAEELGYAHIEVPDHVFGATAREGWTPIYNETDPFHETFVMLGFLAAVT